MKNRWSDFTQEVRGKALNILHERGIHCWQPTFDENAPSVIAICRAIDEGKTVPGYNHEFT